jgi:hypothetical protein
MKSITFCMSFALILFPNLLLAQNMRPACALLGATDLKPLLGADHEAPAPYGDVACMVKSKTAGRLVLLAVVEKSNAELKKDMAAFRKKMSAPEYAQSVSLASAPEFGPDAFFAREKDEQSAADVHAIKGTRAINVTLNWSKGPITEPVFKQLRELTASVLAKLP